MRWALIPEFVVWHPGPAYPFVVFISVACCIGLGLFFYRLRGTRPATYGCVEVAVGVLVLIFTFIPTSHALWVQAPTSVESGATKAIGVMAGIYIIVRGLDNIDRGLPRGWRPHWDRLFPKKNRDL
jgi:hypothetical protein